MGNQQVESIKRAREGVTVCVCVWMPAAMHARQQARQLVRGNLLRGRGGQMREKQRCFHHRLLFSATFSLVLYAAVAAEAVLIYLVCVPLLHIPITFCWLLLMKIYVRVYL